MSLGSLLIQSDPELTRYSANFNNTPTQIANGMAYALDLISVQVDINGDGNIATDEMLTKLSYRSISLLPDVPLWCRTADVSGYCYGDANPDLIAVTDMYNDMVNNFVNSLYHSFDGTGNPLVSAMTSTFPNPSYSVATCQKFDLNYAATPQVISNWKISSVSQIQKVCGYVNGNLSSAFTTTGILSGASTTFTDFKASTTTDFKRVYCITVIYVTGCVDGTALSGKVCPSGSEVITAQSYECSVGLFYVSVN